MIIFKKVKQNSLICSVAIPKRNILEISDHAPLDDVSWVKYWEGNETRSMAVQGTVEQLVEMLKTCEIDQG